MMKKVSVILISLVLLTSASLIIADEDRPEDMPDEVPEEATRDMDLQVAHNDEEIFMRFEWERDDPDWYHQYFVYDEEEDEWSSLGEFYEDRLSILLDDGSVQGFEGWGGWLTAHEGMRDMFELPGEEVEEGIDESDLRKYIPQSREGEEWWDAPWDEVVSEEEIEDMYDEKEFLDLWHVRTHRSVPIREGDSQHVIDYRRGDDGTGPFSTEDLEDGQPQIMYDTDIVEQGALDVQDLREQNLPQDQFFDEYYVDGEWTHGEDPYYVHEDWVVDFDSDIAQWDGAAIPRRILQETEGSRGVLDSSAWHEETTWTAEVRRDLDTEYEDDNVIGEEFDNNIAFGIHDSAGTRYHFTSFPYNLELGDQFEVIEEEGEATIVSEYLGEDEEPDWDEDEWADEIGDGEPETITLPYPGLTSWQWVVEHLQGLGHDLAEDSLWDAFPGPHGPEELGEIAYDMEERYWQTDVEVEYLRVNGRSDEITIGLEQEVKITADMDFPMDIPKPIELRVEDENGDEIHSWMYEVREPKEIERSFVHGEAWDEGEYSVILGDEEVTVTVEEDAPEIVVEDLTVNEEPDEVQVGLDESVSITATVTNEGGTATDVPLIVEGAEDEEGHKGYILEDLGPGDEEEIEWTADEHATWEEGVYIIRVGDQEVEVTVGDPDEDLEISVELTVNGEEDEVTIDEDEEVEIGVFIENEGDTDENFEVHVVMDEESIAPHDPYEEYAVSAGDSVEDTLTHEHVSDWTGEFYVRLLHEETEEVMAEVDVTVGDPEEDPEDDIDWDEIRIIIGLIIAAFVVGMGAGVLFKREF